MEALGVHSHSRDTAKKAAPLTVIDLSNAVQSILANPSSQSSMSSEAKQVTDGPMPSGATDDLHRRSQGYTARSYVQANPTSLSTSQANPTAPNQLGRITHHPTIYSSYIKPATPGAFRHAYPKPAPAPSRTVGSSSAGGQQASRTNHINGWPSWLASSEMQHSDKAPCTTASTGVDPSSMAKLDLDDVPLSASDFVKYEGDADAHMRELLSGVIGEGEDIMGDDAVHEGEDTVDGFATGICLMPHQVRGVRWMRKRESGKNRGGILADDMGLGKTIQSLARIVEGTTTTAERKAGYTGGTLIVTPLAVLEQWAAEIRAKTIPGRLRVTTHHGPGRTKRGKKLEQYDVVITTFQTLASEHGTYAKSEKPTGSGSESDTLPQSKGKNGARKKPGQAMYDVQWLRIVVDEAQNIKNRSTKAAKAAVALTAKYRWCLTGTPIQNNVEELYTLFLFLRAKPLDDWAIFKERIATPVKAGHTKIAMKRLHVVLRVIMLRRTKDAEIDGKPILNLPGRSVKILKCPFDAEERAFYDALEKKTTLTFNKFLRNGTVMANYTSVLTMLLRLRQACDHPSLVTASLAVDKDAIGEDDSPMKFSAGEEHTDDLADLFGSLDVVKGNTCEVCHAKLRQKESKQCNECADLARKARSMSSEAENGLQPQSAKIRKVLQVLQGIDARSESQEKTIVFSQFTSFLNLIEPFLRHAGIDFVRYDGSMRNDKRQEALQIIKSKSQVRVILISLKAGSTGLNLTCCNNVILTDLWWNPALEDQAFDRAHRLGQKLDVNIFKLTVEETVEDRILALQDRKRELAKAALSGEAAKNLTKLTLNDIMALFKTRPHSIDDDDSDDSDD